MTFEPGSVGTSNSSQREGLPGPSQRLMRKRTVRSETGALPGLPEWATSERYDVVAKGATDGSKPNGEQRAVMLQNMLIERFKLKTHTESRELPVYDLVLDSATLSPGELTDRVVAEAHRRFG